MPKLLIDITSMMNRGLCYGRAGDIVSVIKAYGHVIIVQGPDGERFPVTQDKLTEDEAAGTIQSEAKPVEVKPKKTNRRPVKESGSLFQ